MSTFSGAPSVAVRCAALVVPDLVRDDVGQRPLLERLRPRRLRAHILR